jgi:hypothetical protein
MCRRPGRLCSPSQAQPHRRLNRAKDKFKRAMSRLKISQSLGRSAGEHKVRLKWPGKVVQTDFPTLTRPGITPLRIPKPQRMQTGPPSHVGEAPLLPYQSLPLLQPPRYAGPCCTACAVCDCDCVALQRSPGVAPAIGGTRSRFCGGRRRCPGESGRH